MEKQFMLDVEATGVTPDDQILEIGIVEMYMNEGYWSSGRQFHMYIHTDREPESVFAQTHQRHLYRRCRSEYPVAPVAVRKQILEYFSDCGVKENLAENVIFCGWNASNFDVPFMHRMEYLEPPGYKKVSEDKEIKVGDHSYRIYEINGALNFTCDVLGWGRNEVKAKAEEYRDRFTEGLEGKAHDALYDCYTQIGFLNGLIHLFRKDNELKAVKSAYIGD